MYTTNGQIALSGKDQEQFSAMMELLHSSGMGNICSCPTMSIVQDNSFY